LIKTQDGAQLREQLIVQLQQSVHVLQNALQLHGPVDALDCVVPDVGCGHTV
jgi:hypothetical protein